MQIPIEMLEYLFLSSLWAALLHMVCSFALHARRGFDFSDEGWGLLKASGAAGKYGLPIFEEIYTGPLYRLAGGDIRRMRLISLCLSLAAAGVFCLAFDRSLAWSGLDLPGAGFGMALSLVYFLSISFFRITTVTPSPSYANLGGGACVLAFSLSLLAVASNSGWEATGEIVLAGGVSTVLFFTRLPGFFVVVPLLAGLCLAAGGGRGWPLVAGLVLGAALGALLHHRRLLALPELWDRLREGFEMLSRTSTKNYSPPQMVLRDVAYTLKILWSSVRSRWRLLAAMALAPVILPTGLATVAGLGLVLWMGGLFVARNRAALFKVRPNEALVMRLFLDLTLLLAAYHLGNFIGNGPLPPGRVLVLVAACLLVSLGHAAYSWHLTMRNTHYAAELWAAPPLYLALAAGDPARLWLASGVCLCGVFYALLRFRAGYHDFPLSSGEPMPRRLCTHPVSYGRGELLLPAAHAEFLHGLKEAARAAGHRPQLPVLPCFNLFGLVFFLQGTLPWTSQYTDHPETSSLEGLGGWIGEHAGEEARRALVIDLYPERTKRFLLAMGIDFPAGYEECWRGLCPHTGRDATLWKPKLVNVNKEEEYDA